MMNYLEKMRTVRRMNIREVGHLARIPRGPRTSLYSMHLRAPEVLCCAVVLLICHNAGDFLSCRTSFSFCLFHPYPVQWILSTVISVPPDDPWVAISSIIRKSGLIKISLYPILPNVVNVLGHLACPPGSTQHHNYSNSEHFNLLPPAPLEPECHKESSYRIFHHHGNPRSNHSPPQAESKCHSQGNSEPIQPHSRSIQWPSRIPCTP
jgi:hypothetical protein